MVDAPRSASSVQRATPRAEPPRPQEVAGKSDHAERFASALARQEERKGKPKGLLDTRADAGDTPQPAPVAVRPEAPVAKKADAPKAVEKQDAGDGSAAAPTERHAAAANPAPLPAAPATAELAAQFAERIALPASGTGQSQVQFDERLYAVSSVVIESGVGEGLSISYQASSDTGGHPSEGEDGLRRRLEARGLKVGAIGRG